MEGDGPVELMDLPNELLEMIFLAMPLIPDTVMLYCTCSSFFYNRKCQKYVRKVKSHIHSEMVDMKIRGESGLLLDKSKNPSLKKLHFPARVVLLKYQQEEFKTMTLANAAAVVYIRTNNFCYYWSFSYGAMFRNHKNLHPFHEAGGKLIQFFKAPERDMHLRRGVYNCDELCFCEEHAAEHELIKKAWEVLNLPNVPFSLLRYL